MKFRTVLLTAVLIGTLFLGACATDQWSTTMRGTEGNQEVTVPKSTVTGAASGEQANALAKMIVDANNNSMKEFDKIDGHLKNQDQRMAKIEESQQAAQQALAKLEKMANDQGTGQITLFFKTGSHVLDNEQNQRLVRFLDYLSVSSRGRNVIIMSIGSASAIGNAKSNKKLSQQRSEAPVAMIEKYLINTPHTLYKVTGIGDIYAPKGKSMQVEQRYQNVRIIAVYDTSALPATPGQ